MAQQLLLGNTRKTTVESVKRATDSQQFAVVRFTDSKPELLLIPAVNCGATIIRPLRGLTFCLSGLDQFAIHRVPPGRPRL